MIQRGFRTRSDASDDRSRADARPSRPPNRSSAWRAPRGSSRPGSRAGAIEARSPRRRGSWRAGAGPAGSGSTTTRATLPRFFGVGPSGQVQVVSVSGAQAVDWEDIERDHTAAGDGLWLADIGDNLVNRPNVELYRVPEPAAGTGAVAATRLTLTYPDGPHNAEALLRDPATGTLFILTKEPGISRIYTFTPPASGGGQRTPPARRALPGRCVARRARDRSRRVARPFADRRADLWRAVALPAAPRPVRPRRGQPCRVPHAVEVQGEAIGFLPDSRGYATISEGRLASHRAVPRRGPEASLITRARRWGAPCWAPDLSPGPPPGKPPTSSERDSQRRRFDRDAPDSARSPWATCYRRNHSRVIHPQHGDNLCGPTVDTR